MAISIPSASCASAILVGVVLWTMPRPTTLLDELHADYHEDAPGRRVVAAITARLHASGSSRRLDLELAARGPRVVPFPGLEGVHGTNLRSAQELHRLLRDGELELRVRGASAAAGRVVSVLEERLPARSLTPDGDVRLRDATPAAWPSRVHLQTEALPEGRAIVDVFVAGVSRLRVTVCNDAVAPRIEAIESLGEFQEVGR